MLQGSRRISCLVSLSVCWPGCTSWIQSQGKLVTLLYIPVLVKKDDDVCLSSQWFQPFLVLMQKLLPFFLFGICLEVYRCWQVASRIFYSAKALFYCKICTKKEGVLLTGARSPLWPSATVVCLQVSSLCISGWVLFLNKDFIRQWILVNIYFFCFLFSLPFFYSNPWLCTE